jgi:hypothetical protein|uniref:Uncharacterized protein n=1 Tax=Acinetobacter phage vB_AbaSt_W16 TaxID=3116434 RepID=A0AB38ZCV2_9CAUD
MSDILFQIKNAWEDAEGFSEKAPLAWRVLFGLLFCIPLLYLAGFLCGCVMFKNPFEAGSQTVNAMF